jgi:hypothetical protein
MLHAKIRRVDTTAAMSRIRGSRSGSHEEFFLLGSNAMHFALLATCFTPISCLAYSSALKMEATYCSRNVG